MSFQNYLLISPPGSPLSCAVNHAHIHVFRTAHCERPDILNPKNGDLYEKQTLEVYEARPDGLSVRSHRRTGLRAERRISGSTSNFTTLGATLLKVLVTLAGLGFVGLMIWGGLTLTTNRPRGLAMIGGGLVGALLAGLAFAIVSTLTGNAVSTMLLFEAVC